MTTIAPASLAAHYAREEERCLESARDHLRSVIDDAKAHLDYITENGYPRSSVGGSCLNGQHFADAERALVLLKAAADASDLAGRLAGAAPEDERTIADVNAGA